MAELALGVVLFERVHNGGIFGQQFVDSVLTAEMNLVNDVSY